jgi:hypothetical protein
MKIERFLRWTKCGVFWVARKTKFGPGLLDVVGLVQWWRGESGIVGKRHVIGDGKPLQSPIVGVIVIVISDRLMV